MNVVEIEVPDINGYKDVNAIEVMVKAGDVITVDQALIMLEANKATMDVPSSVAGKIIKVKVKVGDEVSQGTVIATAETDATAAPAPVQAPAPAATPAAVPAASAPAP